MDPAKSPPLPQLPQSPSTSQPFACNLCHQRKVKCDRLVPCANCKKSQITCEYREGRKSRPLKRKFSDELARYQDALQHHKYPTYAPYHADDRPAESTERESHAPPTPGPPKGGNVTQPEHNGDGGRFMKEDGKLRYIETSLWKTVAEEIRHFKHEPRGQNPVKDVFPPSVPVTGVPQGMRNVCGTDASALLLGNPGDTSNLREFHPPPIHMYSLLNTYLENVNPISKIVHTSSIQKEFQSAAENLEKVPANTQALMFAMYLCAVLSSTEDDCQSFYGESRSSLLSRYHSATERALSSSRFLGTLDFTVLQAFTVYLLAMQLIHDPRTMWSLAGVAVRIAQGQGLHRDGASFKLPPFEAEMRRRLWYQIIFVEAHSTQRAGCGVPNVYDSCDTKLPLNVNDADLYPDMKEAPAPRKGATEMIYFLMFCEMLVNFRIVWRDKKRNPRSNNARDDMLPHMEETLEDKFLKYCDPLEPLHSLCSTMARSSICKLRLLLHHPRQLSMTGNNDSVTQSKREISFSNSLKLVEYDNFMSSKPLQRFRWHANTFVEYPGVIYMLLDLKTRPIDDPQTNRAWDQIEQIFENRGEFMAETNKAIHSAICSLCLKAWESREAKHEEKARQQYKNASFYGPSLRTPKFIVDLRRRRGWKQEPPGDSGTNNPQGNTNHHGFVAINGNANTTSTSSNGAQQSDADAVDPYLGLFDDSSLFGDLSGGFIGSINWELWDELIRSGQ